MMNFLFGTVAGGVIACVCTIAAARHPDVQLKLGLVQPAQAALAVTPIAHIEPRCPAVAKTADAALKASHADKLFEHRRFWFVAP